MPTTTETTAEILAPGETIFKHYEIERSVLFSDVDLDQHESWVVTYRDTRNGVLHVSLVEVHSYGYGYRVDDLVEVDGECVANYYGAAFIESLFMAEEF